MSAETRAMIELGVRVAFLSIGVFCIALAVDRPGVDFADHLLNSAGVLLLFVYVVLGDVE